ncbi:hypothetical protein BDZ89DRAFT_1169700 [Hymenopellis radicata]|nr:hypothetical protein BDZ89DRAFT_1169700 [Hymenopellis radicata]
MSSPRPSTPSVRRLPTLPQTSVTPPRAPIPPPRLIRPAPPRALIPPPRLIRPAPPRDSAPISSPSKKGKKRVREDKSTESVSPPPQAKKCRALRPANANEAVPDISSIPDQRTLRSHPSYDDYVASFPTAVGGAKGIEERKKILESDWSVAKIDGPDKVVCIGCKNARKVAGYYQHHWVDHRKTCWKLMARWMVKEGFATEDAARREGVSFEDSEPLPEQTSS